MKCYEFDLCIKAKSSCNFQNTEIFRVSLRLLAARELRPKFCTVKRISFRRKNKFLRRNRSLVALAVSFNRNFVQFGLGDNSYLSMEGDAKININIMNIKIYIKMSDDIR